MSNNSCNLLSLNPSFFTGFVQADGCFHVSIQKDKTAKHKYRLKPTFYVTQLNSEKKSISLVLRMARNLLQVGHYIPDKKSNCSTLRVNTLKMLNNNVLPHFKTYPLLPEKRNDFLVFKEIVERMSKKEHLEKETFLDLLKKAVYLNKRGLYRKKYNLSNFFSIIDDFPYQSIFLDKYLPKIETGMCKEFCINAQYLSGLIQGDGSFGFSFRVRKNKKAHISPFFTLVQENNSIQVLNECQAFFRCGKIYPISVKSSRWMVTDFDDLKNNVLPSLTLLDSKGSQFLLFKECLEILRSKDICRKEKIEKVVFLAYNLNMKGKGRKYNKEEYLRMIAS